MSNSSNITAGLQERSIDERDITVGAVITLPAVSELPRRYMIEPISVKNQNADGNQDFCAAYAGCSMIEPKEGTELFPPFLFAAAKSIAGTHPNSWGLELRDVGQALVKHGVPARNSVSDSFKDFAPNERRIFDNYSDKLKQLATEHMAMTFAFSDGPYDHFDNVRATMWKFKNDKKLFVFGCEFGWNIEEYTLSGHPSGFGHAMCVVGWDRDFILCLNSVGFRAGRNGIHAMDRETFNDSGQRYGALTIVDMPKDEVRDMIFKGIKDDDNWLTRLIKNITSLLSSRKISIERKIEAVQTVSELITPKKMQTNSNKLYELAVASIGTDVSPRDIANDAVGCVESITTLLHKVNPNIPVQLSTFKFYEFMRDNPQLFKRCDGPGKERIVISPTGMGNGKISNGHVGICFDEETIMSNTSATGKWEKNYTVKNWNNRFSLRGGFPVYYYYLV